MKLALGHDTVVAEDGKQPGLLDDEHEGLEDAGDESESLEDASDDLEGLKGWSPGGSWMGPLQELLQQGVGLENFFFFYVLFQVRVTVTV